MTHPDRDFERELKSRLSAYALAGATLAQRENKEDRHLPGLPPWIRYLGAAGVAGAAAGLTFTFLSLVNGGPWAGLEPTSSAQATSSPNASPNSTQLASTQATASVAPSAPAQQSAPPASSDTPGPSASTPLGVTTIAGLTLEEVAAPLGAAGYQCNEAAGGGGDNTDASHLTCVRTNGGVTTRVEAVYWSSNAVTTVHAVVLPDGGSVPLETAASMLEPILSLDYEGADPSSAEAWYRENVTNQECVDTPCRTSLGAAVLSLQVGEDAAHTVSWDPPEP